MKAVFVAVWAAVLVGVCAGCRCAQRPFCPTVEDSALLVKGRVKKVEKVPGKPYTIRYKVRVPRVFKGEKPERCLACPGLNRGDVVWVETSASSAACGSILKVGALYLLDLYQSSGIHGPYSTNSCSLTKPWESVSKEERRVLRRGVVCPK